MSLFLSLYTLLSDVLVASRILIGKKFTSNTSWKPCCVFHTAQKFNNRSLWPFSKDTRIYVFPIIRTYLLMLEHSDQNVISRLTGYFIVRFRYATMVHETVPTNYTKWYHGCQLKQTEVTNRYIYYSLNSNGLLLRC
jgi:hypothetical protein